MVHYPPEMDPDERPSPKSLNELIADLQASIRELNARRN